MKTRTDLLNYIAAKIKAENYLEIGVFNPDHNFNRINVKNKIGVDPDETAKATLKKTSDEFFADFIKRPGLFAGQDTPAVFDIIFIDGLHHKEQVLKDIQNAWQCLRVKGVIMLHDTNPHSEHITHVPRDNGEWCGDVYKAICEIDDPYFITADFDYGCTIIRKENAEDFISCSTYTGDFKEFDANRVLYLNLKTLKETIKIIDTWT